MCYFCSIFHASADFSEFLDANLCRKFLFCNTLNKHVVDKAASVSVWKAVDVFGNLPIDGIGTDHFVLRWASPLLWFHIIPLPRSIPPFCSGGSVRLISRKDLYIPGSFSA